jgi:integrase
LSKDIQSWSLHGPVSICTFAKAVDFYLDHVTVAPKEAPRIDRLVAHFGHMKCTEIDANKLHEYRKKVYPEGISNATVRRSIYGPMSAILKMAAENSLCPPILIPKIKVETKLVPAAPEEHIAKLIGLITDKWLKAAVLTLTYHGTRPGDLSRLRWRDVSFASNTITFGRTKNGHPHAPTMHPDVREAYLVHFNEATNLDRNAAVFPLLQSRDAATQINYRLRAICKKAGLPYYSTHKIGRHAFAERIVNNGHTIRELQEAGNWKTYGVVAGRYAHLEKTRVSDIITSMKIGKTNQTMAGN